MPQHLVLCMLYAFTHVSFKALLVSYFQLRHLLTQGTDSSSSIPPHQ